MSIACLRYCVRTVGMRSCTTAQSNNQSQVQQTDATCDAELHRDHEQRSSKHVASASTQAWIRCHADYLLILSASKFGVFRYVLPIHRMPVLQPSLHCRGCNAFWPYSQSSQVFDVLCTRTPSYCQANAISYLLSHLSHLHSHARHRHC